MLASIDLETTGLDPEQDQILEIAVVMDDFTAETLKPVGQLPYFHCFINHEQITGKPIALAMNQDIIKMLAGQKEVPNNALILDPESAFKQLIKFLNIYSHKKRRLTATGKNIAGFDFPFLDKLAGNLYEKEKPHRNFFRHRMLDVGPVFYEPLKDGNIVPNLQTCLESAGVNKKVAHTALEDARDVLKLLRIKYFAQGDN